MIGFAPTLHSYYNSFMWWLQRAWRTVNHLVRLWTLRKSFVRQTYLGLYWSAISQCRIKTCDSQPFSIVEIHPASEYYKEQRWKYKNTGILLILLTAIYLQVSCKFFYREICAGIGNRSCRLPGNRSASSFLNLTLQLSMFYISSWRVWSEA